MFWLFWFLSILLMLVTILTQVFFYTVYFLPVVSFPTQQSVFLGSAWDQKNTDYDQGLVECLSFHIWIFFINSNITNMSSIYFLHYTTSMRFCGGRSRNLHAFNVYSRRTIQNNTAIQNWRWANIFVKIFKGIFSNRSTQIMLWLLT